MIWKDDLEKQNSLLPLEWGKLKSRIILPAGQILLFQCGKRWQDQGQRGGKKAESGIPNCAAWTPPSRVGKGSTCPPSVMQEGGAVHVHCVLKDAPKEKDLLVCPCLSSDVCANQNTAVIGISGEIQGDWEWGAEPFTRGKQAEIMLRLSKIISINGCLVAFRFPCVTFLGFVNGIGFASCSLISSFTNKLSTGADYLQWVSAHWPVVFFLSLDVEPTQKPFQETHQHS